MTEFLAHEPKAHPYRETIGDAHYLLPASNVDVFEDVTLWSENPRLIPFLAEHPAESEDDLAASLQRTPGYQGLRKSIADIGQLEPIYVWKRDEHQQKYLVLEGATRVTILRELALKYAGQPTEDGYRYAKAKILPPEFGQKDRVILLARIHVRGSGVRSWGRHIEAKFIYDHVVGVNGQPPVMKLTDMARWMGKSVSWASRLRDAYEFAQKFVEFLDRPDSERKAVQYFSILEEISKSRRFGPRIKEDSKEGEGLREEVFEMVAADVFKEYRDARFMQEYYEDPEKWEQLKSHEPGIANKLANEIKAGTSNLKGKIAGLPKRIERTLARDTDALDVDDLENLEDCVSIVADHVAADLGQLRIRMKWFKKALYNASLDEILKVTPEEYQELMNGIGDFEARLRQHASWWG